MQMTKEKAFGKKCLWKSWRVCSQTASTVQGSLFLLIEGRASTRVGWPCSRQGSGPGPNGGDGDNILAEHPPQVPGNTPGPREPKAQRRGGARAVACHQLGRPGRDSHLAAGPALSCTLGASQQDDASPYCSAQDQFSNT